MRRASRYLTAATLALIGGLHLAWGLGASFPFGNRDDLADSVVGAHDVPAPSACYAIAGALFTASALVADIPIGPRPLRKVGRWGVAGVLATRGGLGLAGRTDVASPGSTSPRFRRLDRRYYSPLCLALAAGAVTAPRRAR